MKKKALITGISGQDGAYLAKFLLEKNYKIIGTDRRSARGNNWRLKRLGIINKIEFEEMELGELYEIERIFKKYNLDLFTVRYFICIKLCLVIIAKG